MFHFRTLSLFQPGFCFLELFFLMEQNLTEEITKMLQGLINSLDPQTKKLITDCWLLITAP